MVYNGYNIKERGILVKTLIKNGRVIIPEEILNNYDLAIEEGKITAILPSSILRDSDFDEVIDADNNYISPGFLDIHTHGISGYDVMDATFESIDSMAKFHLKNGVTGFLATTMTASIKKTKRVIKNVANYVDYLEANDGKDKAEVLGIYLEGPYISPDKKGAQALKYIRAPKVDTLVSLLKTSNNLVRVVAIAPERPGALDVINYLRDKGITATCAHTDANFDEAATAIDSGITLATHIFNAMRNFSHREPGVVGAALADDRVYCEMICDGIHLHPAVMKLVIKAKGIEKVVLISDSMMAAGLSDGEYTLGGQRVIVRGSEARLSDGTLAGSTLTLRKAIYNAVHMLGVPLHSAVRMATLNPARVIGISDRKGSIELDKDADIVIFDEYINILKVMKNGKVFI